MFIRFEKNEFHFSALIPKHTYNDPLESSIITAYTAMGVCQKNGAKWRIAMKKLLLASNWRDYASRFVYYLK